MSKLEAILEELGRTNKLSQSEKDAIFGACLIMFDEMNVEASLTKEAFERGYGESAVKALNTLMKVT